MAYAPIALVAPQYDEQDGYWLKFYKPNTTTPIEMSIDASGSTKLDKAELDNDGFPTTDGTQIFIPFLDQSYDAFLFPTEQEADNNDTANAISIARNINPFGDGFTQEIFEIELPYTTGNPLLNVPETPNSLILYKDGDFQQLGDDTDAKDYLYDPANGNIILTVAPTGNEVYVAVYGSIVSVTGITVDGAKVYNTLQDAMMATDLESGDVFFTCGYHSLNDGGAAQYKVVNLALINPGQLDYVLLPGTGLLANIIPKNNEITLSQAGAKFFDEGAAGYDDRALQELIDYCIFKGVKGVLDGKEANLYNSHPINGEITLEGVGFDSVLRSRSDNILLDMSDPNKFYNNTVIKGFTLQSNARQNDTAMKIHGLFEGSVVKDLRVVGFRYGMHLTEQFNGEYNNVYVRQGASRHSPNGGNDPSPSYGWWLDGSEGQLNAIAFINCGAERNWHNLYIDNTDDVGGFVALNFLGGVFQTSWQSGIVIRGGGTSINFEGTYLENNFEQAQILSGGAGVPSDQGVNLTIDGISGSDLVAINIQSGYWQLSQNLKNNTPETEVYNAYIDSSVERVNIAVGGSHRIVTNDPNSYDWDFYILGGATEFRPNFEDFSSSKGSDESIFTDGKFIRDIRFEYGPDDGTGSNFTVDFRNFSTRSGRCFFEVTPRNTDVYTSPPSYVIQDFNGSNVATVNIPASLTAGETFTQRITGLVPNEVYRIAQNTTSVGGSQFLTFQVYEKILTATRFISQEN